MLPTIPLDKAEHYIYGQGIFALSVATCYYPSWHLSLRVSSVVGWSIVAFFAAGKEVRDKVTKLGTPDPLDAVATLLGAVIPFTALSLAF